MLDPAARSPRGAGSHGKRRDMSPQPDSPSQCSPTDAPRGFEDSVARGRKLGDAHSMNFSFLLQSILLSASIKREGDSPTASPHSSDDIHHSDRYQVSRWMPSLGSALGREPARPVARSSLCVRAPALSCAPLPQPAHPQRGDTSNGSLTWPRRRAFVCRVLPALTLNRSRAKLL